MDTPKRDNNPFGLVYFTLHHQLYKSGRYAQAQFNLYISCRSNIPGWQFNESDIRVMTGISRNTVKAHCNAFVLARIFLPDGTTANGSPRYKLDKAKFLSYMRGSQPLDAVRERASFTKETCAPNLKNNPILKIANLKNDPSEKDSINIEVSAHPPVNGNLGGTVNGNLGGLSMAIQGGSSPLTPNNKENKEEEIKDTHTRARECVSVLNSREENALTKVTALTKEPPLVNSFDNKTALELARAYFIGPNIEQPVNISTVPNPTPVQRSASPVACSSSAPETPASSSTQRFAFLDAFTSSAPPSVIIETIADSDIQGVWPSYVATQRLSKRQLDIWHTLHIQHEEEERRRKLEQERLVRELAALRFKEYQESRAYTPRFDELSELRWNKEGGLSPSERAEYVCEYLKTMRGNGYYDKQENRKRTFRLVVTEDSLRTIYSFFELNPTCDPDALIKSIEKCCMVNITEREPEQGEYCEHFYQWKAGANLTFFWKYFSNVSEGLAAVPPAITGAATTKANYTN